MSAYKIAIVDDDAKIREIVSAYLNKEGYRTFALSTAEEALALWKRESPDLWVLDINLPKMNGYDFCRQIRKETEVPIIMISARDEEVDRILGIELGSDDYLTKPFSPRELVARVNRLFYRLRTLHPQAGDHRPLPVQKLQLELDDLKLVIEERQVFWRGKEINMTAKEFTLLRTLLEQPNRAFSRDELLTLVWGADYFGSDRAIDDLVKRLRRKINELPIETVWGHGYRLRVQGEEEQI
ncbi:response regulator transcription factor [Paenibacillus radicis (ex Gao et al. 2016)]|uniref:DNA-binding response regulator n=1 Tax=Paenibacillus radicis (ex Gao et al. 2016) TaxID=1737354 RepID=A0A917HQM7_9BACL|nr:response regulator transcription factor [Paenibacillus radicis (ex Gao et al. 2016)]GGG85916.1 DNA-binding response regulator [Paenibacillus radicis (ex Gao et al. 2016)]